MDEIDLSIALGLTPRPQQRSGVALMNVSLLGITFFFIYTCYGTSMFIEELAVNSVNNEFADKWNGKQWNAHELLGVNYAIFGLFCCLSPSLIDMMGPKVAMIVHGLILSSASLSFIFPTPDGLVFSAIGLGVGQAVLWTAQGNLLTINSKDETIMRNSGIFWALYQTSLLVGNSIVYNRFEDHRTIDRPTRNITFTGLTICSLLGVLALFALREPTDAPRKKVGAWKSLSKIKY